MKPRNLDDPAVLRRAAEAHLKIRPPNPPAKDEGELRRLQHELEVHQIELEMQNEELRAARTAIEAELERYSDHFDFAPVGYYNLTAQGTIQLVNLTGAKFVNVERARLLGRSFTLLVAPLYRRAFKDFLTRVFTAKSRQTCELALATKGHDSYFVRLDATLSPDGIECRTAILDITERKRGEESIKQSEEQLRALAARLQSIREEERGQIAREIHDVLAQELALLKFDAVWAGHRLAKTVDEPGRLALLEKLNGITLRTNSVISTVQRIATDLRPVVLDTLGLFAAVEWQTADFAKRTGIVCPTSVPSTEPAISREQATAVFRIVQESLTNVLRHAHATRVAVTLAIKGEQMSLTVSDNGCGIAREKWSDIHSIGLAGMRERAFAFGGQLDIAGSPSSGTTVVMLMPLIHPVKIAKQ